MGGGAARGPDGAAREQERTRNGAGPADIAKERKSSGSPFFLFSLPFLFLSFYFIFFCLSFFPVF